jgi:hypothetical protein
MKTNNMPRNTFTITSSPGLEIIINEYLNGNKINSALKLIKVDTQFTYAIYTFKTTSSGNWPATLFYLGMYIGKFNK